MEKRCINCGDFASYGHNKAENNRIMINGVCYLMGSACRELDDATETYCSFWIPKK